MRVLVCGGRDFKDGNRIMHELLKLAEDVPGEDDRPIKTIIHGCCPTGADAIASALAVGHCIPEWRFPANWMGEGKAAGPKRNQRMLEIGKPDVVLAFPGGRGTADMVRRAKAAGVRVIEVPTVRDRSTPE